VKNEALEGLLEMLEQIGSRSCFRSLEESLQVIVLLDMSATGGYN